MAAVQMSPIVTSPASASTRTINGAFSCEDQVSANSVPKNATAPQSASTGAVSATSTADRYRPSPAAAHQRSGALFVIAGWLTAPRSSP